MGNGKVTWVDSRDYTMLRRWKWCTSGPPKSGLTNVYAVHGIYRHDGTRKTMLMHRLIMLPDPELQVDHINHDGLDNRRVNLRIATPAQNRANSRSDRGASSPFKGVYHDRSRRCWTAQIQTTRLGSFTSEEDAAIAYDIAARERYGDFACTNFPGIKAGSSACPHETSCTEGASHRCTTASSRNTSTHPMRLEALPEPNTDAAVQPTETVWCQLALPILGSDGLRVPNEAAEP